MPSWKCTGSERCGSRPSSGEQTRHSPTTDSQHTPLSTSRVYLSRLGALTVTVDQLTAANTALSTKYNQDVGQVCVAVCVCVPVNCCSHNTTLGMLHQHLITWLSCKRSWRRRGGGFRSSRISTRKLTTSFNCSTLVRRATCASGFSHSIEAPNSSNNLLLRL